MADLQNQLNKKTQEAQQSLYSHPSPRMFDYYSSAPPTTPLPFYSPLHLQQQHQGVTPSLSLPPSSSEWDKPKPFYTPITTQTQPVCSGTEMWVHKFREQQREQQRKSLEKRTTEGSLPQPTKPKTVTPTAPSPAVTFVPVTLTPTPQYAPEKPEIASSNPPP